MSARNENLKPSHEVNGEELDRVARHNIESAIQIIMHQNKCSYADAVEATKRFADFLVDLKDTAVKGPDYDEK